MSPKKPLTVILIIFVIIVLASVGILLINLKGQPTAIVNENEAYLLGLDELSGACGLDLSAKDLSNVSLEVLSEINFNSQTLWPDASKLPNGFSPEKWLEDSKNFGLGLDKLHQMGITGKGVSIAIMDKPILNSHKEFSGRMVYIETDNPGNFQQLHFHGISCASLIAGQSCGVAPEATIYYFAVPDNGQNFTNYGKAMDQLIELNSTLPYDQKIRLVSISDGLNNDDSAKMNQWQLVLDKAKQEGIAVNYSNGLDQHWEIAYGGCPPYADRDNADNYVAEKMKKGGRIPKSLTLIPSGYRTTASNEGDQAYRYWPSGGFSWAIAYTSGLCALAYQVNPDIAYEDIITVLCETRRHNQNGYGFIDPVGFIEAVKNFKD